MKDVVGVERVLVKSVVDARIEASGLEVLAGTNMVVNERIGVMVGNLVSGALEVSADMGCAVLLAAKIPGVCCAGGRPMVVVTVVTAVLFKKLGVGAASVVMVVDTNPGTNPGGVGDEAETVAIGVAKLAASLCVGLMLFNGQITCGASPGPFVIGLQPGRLESEPCTGSSHTEGDSGQLRETSTSSLAWSTGQAEITPPLSVYRQS